MLDDRLLPHIEHGRRGTGPLKRGNCWERALSEPRLKPQLAELREVAGEVTARAAGALQEPTGVAHAGDVPAQWEGFSRLCRDVLAVEPRC